MSRTPQPLTELEARRVLGEAVADLRRLGYDELRQRVVTKTLFGGLLQLGGRNDIDEVAGASGRQYSIETQYMWDDHRGGNVRCIVRLYEDDLANTALSADFIIGSGNQFVGED